jgi:hypothetical protein
MVVRYRTGFAATMGRHHGIPIERLLDRRSRRDQSSISGCADDPHSFPRTAIARCPTGTPCFKRTSREHSATKLQTKLGQRFQEVPWGSRGAEVMSSPCIPKAVARMGRPLASHPVLRLVSSRRRMRAGRPHRRSQQEAMATRCIHYFGSGTSLCVRASSSPRAL